MRIVLATDAFPPVCGGSGWSTYELARGLRSRGHSVTIVQPRPRTRRGVRETTYDGLMVLEFGAPAPPIPYVRNYFKNEKLYADLAGFLTGLVAREGIDLVHGQHVMTSVPSVIAARRSSIPAVCTVRDYWPVCYWSDLIHTTEGLALCPGCSAAMMTRCVRPHAGQLGIAGADAIIAVSSTIANDLRARSPGIATARIEIIPNAVNVAALRECAAASAPPLPGPYALYLGKLAPNKGTRNLVGIIERAGLDWPVVIAGDGPERDKVAAGVTQSDRDIRMIGWVDQRAAAAWMGHASMLIFPSRGPESLSRVLIEASALGVPIAAMSTGGTPDIVVDEETGLLSATPEELADDIRRLRGDAELRARVGAAARLHAEARFDAPAVVERVERLYIDLTKRRR